MAERRIPCRKQQRSTGFSVKQMRRSLRLHMEEAQKNLLNTLPKNDGVFFRSDEKRVEQRLARNGLQLPTLLTLSNSDITMPQGTADVNTQYTQGKIKQYGGMELPGREIGRKTELCSRKIYISVAFPFSILWRDTVY